MNCSKLLVLASAGVLMAVRSSVAQIDVGARETSGIDVPTGEPVSETGPVRVSDGADFYKTGKGELEMPLAAVDTRVPTTVKVLDGTLKLTTDAVAAPDADNPPALIAEKAAFWTDATAGKGLVEAAGDDDAVLASRWLDRRETNPDAPTRWYADADWGRDTRAGAPEQSAYPLWGVPPAVQTVDGRRTVYFGGGKSSQGMTFMMNGAAKQITGVKDYFVVFGVTNWLGVILGGPADANSVMFNVGVSQWDETKNPPIARFFYRRSNVGTANFVSAQYLDGRRFDAYSEGPKRGFQLFEGHAVDQAASSVAKSFFLSYSNIANGGDYLSEAIVFTNALTETERVQVERYLMAKWNLPHVLKNTDKLPLQREYSSVAVAEGATVEVSAGAGEATDSLRLQGEGDIVKTGDGTLFVGPSGAFPFTGAVDLRGGAVAAKGGPILPLKTIRAGQRVNSSERRFSDAAANTAEGQASAATCVTVSDDAGDGVAIKDGKGPARIRAIGADVQRLKVNEGLLVLDAGVKAKTLEGEGVISATIPNGDFEEYVKPAGGTDAYRQFSKAPKGWSNQNQSQQLLTSVSLPGQGNAWGTWCSYPCPQGTNVLYLIANAGTCVTMTFPKSGYYRFSCLASPRNRGTGYQKYAPVDIYLGDTYETRQAFGTLITGPDSGFQRYYFKTPYVEAGKTYIFGVHARSNGDSGMAMDDFKMDYIADVEQTATWEIPNGGFDDWASSVTDVHAVKAAHTAKNWTLSDAATAAGLPLAALVTPGTTSAYGGTRTFKTVDPVWGSTMCALIGNSAWAETTFTPPAGTWRLRGRATDWPCVVGGSNWDAGSVKLEATLTVGGAATSLGTVTVTSHLITDFEWPTAFTSDGTTPVTLRLSNNTASSGILIDDFKLADETDPCERELLKDTVCETSTSWKALDPPPQKQGEVYGGMIYSYGGYVDSTQTQPRTSVWGHNRMFGGAYMLVVENGGLQQPVDIPKAGTYRLTFTDRSRLGTGNGGNPLTGWIRSEDGSYTNFIFSSPSYVATNFVEHTYHFRLPAAGKYVLAFQGTGINWRTVPREDLETIVDGVSLKYVKDELVDVPSVANTTRIAVAKGAKLALDFPGTVEVGSVKLGGVPARGIINSSTHPEFISGMGSLNAVPKTGAVILFR